MASTAHMARSRSVSLASLISAGALLVSGCSGSQSSNSYTPSRNVGAASTTQTSVPTGLSAAASAGSVNSMQTAATPPSPVAPIPSTEHLAGIGSATVLTVHGKIVSVDRANKLVTLVG